MNEWPLVSLVTPVLNGAQSIQRTIDSIRQQDYPHIEHIVMDAGSTDGTIDILRANEAHLTWVSQADKGQSDAINKGFERASGHLVNWLNADDFLRPNSVSHCVEVFRENPAIAMVYGHLDLVNMDGSLRYNWPGAHNGTFDELLHWDNFVAQPGTLFTREVWESVNRIDVDLYWCMDWDLFIKIARVAPIKYTPRTLAALAVYPETKSSSGGLPRLHENLRMLERNGSRAPHLYYKIGHWHYQHNEMNQARHYFQIALTRGPSPLIRRRTISLILKSYLGGRIMDAARGTRKRLSF